MPAKRDRQSLIDVAHMYYIEGLDQGQVGRRLGISRSSVSRMLADARKSGIVQVRIAGDGHIDRDHQLERDLTHAFGLREALVAPADSMATALESVGQLAGQFFTRRSPSATRIGFSWGFTVGQLIDAVPQMTLRPDTRLIPLVGGMPLLDTAPSGNTHIQTLADKCGLVAERFDAPAIVESSLTYRAMMSESSVKAALTRAETCDLAFIGIGSFGVHTSKKILDSMRLSDEELATVLASRPAGDILGRFFDIEGRSLGPPSSERVIGIEIEAARSIGTAVGLAAGKEKVRGVLGALRTGVLDVLIVDEELATALLRLLTSYLRR